MSSTGPSSRWGHVALIIDEEMLLWGGKAMRESTGEKFYCCQDVIECLNLSTSEWNQRRAISNIPQSDIPHPCSHARIGVVQNRDIYQFGGGYFSSDDRRVYSNDVHKLDGSTLEWQRIHSNDQSTPSGRVNHGMCVLGKKGDEHLVMMGGIGTPIVSPIPDGSQFIPSSNYPDEGWNNEVWLFCIRKRNWIPAQCTGKKPHPRDGHSFITVDNNRAILFGGSYCTKYFNDIYVFHLNSMEWIQVHLDGPHHFLPLYGHSTNIVHIPGLGPCAIVLWGVTNGNRMVSIAHFIVIDSQQCHKVTLANDVIRTVYQSTCSLLRKNDLFLIRFGGTNDFKTWKPVALLDILKFDGFKGISGTSSPRVPMSLESCQLPCQIADPRNAEQEQALVGDLVIERDELKYDEADDFIGSGGFGEVYKATLKKNEKEQTVAVKVFKAFRHRREKKECEDFEKESSILLRIKPHRFIVELIGRCTNVRHYALITAFVSGGNLHELLSSGNEAIQRMEVRITIAKQIAIGMVHLHYNCPPVIHYDLKSDNILVEKQGDDFICKICDFGFSKMSIFSAVTSYQSAGSLPSGTATYIAPERYRVDSHEGGARRVTLEEARKVDVYSYGVLLWEIREKTRPYKGMPERVIHHKAEEGQKLPEGKAASEAPSYYNILLEKCQDCNPRVRPTFRQAVWTLQGDTSILKPAEVRVPKPEKETCCIS
ncbi:uncharacterized protein [Oscarella lobularis]|uniref:uncharacterized protein n=1 Tax=Oscarella lobularis TaxID=121494 RepID=UPI0033138C1C